MSFERTAMNCSRCYKVAQSYHSTPESRLPDRFKETSARLREKERLELERCCDEQIYESRNEAMKSLEETLPVLFHEHDEDSIKVVKGLLYKCMYCDYSRSEIAQGVESLEFSKK